MYKPYKTAAKKSVQRSGPYRSYKTRPHSPEISLTLVKDLSPDQVAYDKLVDTYRSLFRIARYPTDSPHGAERQLDIVTERDADGAVNNRAIVTSLKPTYSQYGVSFLEAHGFEVSWFKYSNGERQQTYTDTFSYGHQGCPQRLQARYTSQWNVQNALHRAEWLHSISDRAASVNATLLDAIRDPWLNPQIATHAELYYQSLPAENVVQLIGHTALESRIAAD